ncbi:hypothetical protein [Nitrososphaera sp.]|uniref:hypothetical protein n=1 Tax=Nitrososphaera sp. TaxID=1971748 RepID=UPI00307D533C
MAFLGEKKLLSLALAGTLASSIFIVSGFLFLGDGGSNNNAHLPWSHQQQSSSNTADASPFPLQIEKGFKKKVVDGQALYGVGALKIYDDWVNSEISCEFCTRLEYTPTNQQSAPELSYVDKGDGTSPSLVGAKKVSFYVRGENGGEVVKFKAAGKSADDAAAVAAAGNGPQQPKDKQQQQKSIKFAVASKPVNLEKSWKKLELDLTQENLAGVVEPFAVELAKNSAQGRPGGPVVIYLKAITYDDSLPRNPLPEEPATAPPPAQ